MSDLIIFVIGVFIFGLTVYGAVVGGGLLMHIQHMRENPAIDERAKARRLSKTTDGTPDDPAVRKAA